MKDSSKDAKERLEKIQRELAELQTKRDEFRAQWLSEKEIIAKIRIARSRLKRPR